MVQPVCFTGFGSTSPHLGGAAILCCRLWMQGLEGPRIQTEDSPLQTKLPSNGMANKKIV